MSPASSAYTPTPTRLGSVASSSISTSLAPTGAPTYIPLSAVREGLPFILVATALSSFLVPITVVLFFFSTFHLRRQPIFIFNVCAVVLGLAEGALIIYAYVEPMLNKPGNPLVIVAIASVTIVLPIVVQTILLIRVVAVYPPRLLSLARRLAVYTPIVFVKIARVANVCYLVYTIRNAVTAGSATTKVATSVWNLSNMKVEWLLQLFDDGYLSVLFLLRLHKGTRTRSNFEHGADSLQTVPIRYSYTRRLKTLLCISTSNFVFPVILNIVQLVFIFRDHNFLDGSYVLVVNNYVTIIGVLLATIWSSGSHWQQNASVTQFDTDVEPPPGASGSAPECRIQVSEDVRKKEHTFCESIRDSATQVGDGDLEDRYKWLSATLSKKDGSEVFQSSLCSSVLYDNTGEPVFYAV